MSRKSKLKAAYTIRLMMGKIEMVEFLLDPKSFVLRSMKVQRNIV